jgi:hypothetical protein
MKPFPVDIELPSPKRRFRSSNVLPLFLLAMFVLQVLLLLLVLFNGVQVTRIAAKPPPALVQLVDGRAIQATSVEDSLHRETPLIDRLVREWATLTMNWSGKFPNGKPDPGVDVGEGKVPSSTWVASFVLSEDFRQGFLRYLAKEIVPPEIFEGRTQTALQIEKISQAKPIKDEQGDEIPGYWHLELVANLMVVDLSNPIGEPVPFNKTIFLRAVPPPLYPLEAKATEIQKAVYKLRESGLEIFKIEDLQPPLISLNHSKSGATTIFTPQPKQNSKSLLSFGILNNFVSVFYERQN